MTAAPRAVGVNADLGTAQHPDFKIRNERLVRSVLTFQFPRTDRGSPASEGKGCTGVRYAGGSGGGGREGRRARRGAGDLPANRRWSGARDRRDFRGEPC